MVHYHVFPRPWSPYLAEVNKVVLSLLLKHIWHHNNSLFNPSWPFHIEQLVFTIELLNVHGWKFNISPHLIFHPRNRKRVLKVAIKISEFSSFTVHTATIAILKHSRLPHSLQGRASKSQIHEGESAHLQQKFYESHLELQRLACKLYASLLHEQFICIPEWLEEVKSGTSRLENDLLHKRTPFPQ